MVSRFFRTLDRLIHQPLKVFLWGVILTSILLLVDGSLWQFWSLQRGQTELRERMADLKEKSEQLQFEIHQAQELTYIERQATDQFDYVREGDLIFVFSE